jgi:ABC-2 type transport system permease protein
LLANPVTRSRVLLERYAAVVALLAALVGLFTALLLVGAAAVDGLDGVRITGLLGACAGVFGLALLFGSLAFAVGAATGRRGSAIAVATVAAVGGYLVRMLLAVADVLRPARYLTPWHWYLDRNMLAQGPAPVAIVVPLLLSALFLAAGWTAFVRRDLR